MPIVDHTLFLASVGVYIDPDRPVGKAIITHGHADHARAGHGSVLATPETIAIMQARYGADCARSFQPLPYGESLALGDMTLSLHPAGHILGSAQVLLEHKGRRIVVTGDYKTVPDATCAAFECVPCDLLITEATFALPVFRHPPPACEIDRLIDSLKTEAGRTHLVGAYALGKAQRVIALLRAQGYDRPIYLHGAMDRLCGLYQAHGVALGSLRPVADTPARDLAGEIVIAPPSSLADRWSRRFGDPLRAMASGWMQVKQRAKQRGVELPLVLSDHADWAELTATIEASGANEVWVTHGREDALIHYCGTRGLKAAALALAGRDEDGGDGHSPTGAAAGT